MIGIAQWVKAVEKPRSRFFSMHAPRERGVRISVSVKSFFFSGSFQKCSFGLSTSRFFRKISNSVQGPWGGGREREKEEKRKRGFLCRANLG